MIIFQNPGYCHCCTTHTTFQAHGGWYRDEYLCASCGCIPRERAIMYCIDHFKPNWRHGVTHESSPATRGASLRLQKECARYIGSQYYPEIPFGQMKNGFRSENLEALTFPDESIDLHVSQDVLEHVFDPAAVFREVARTLKKGGMHIFTTPLVNKVNPSQRKAELGPDGNVILHGPAEYHGNPISGEGSLVTMHWGYDITKEIFDACGLFTDVIYLDSLDWGIRAEYIEVLITRKP